MLKPVIAVVVAILLGPLVLDGFGAMAEAAGEAFSGTITIGSVEVDAGGLAQIILFLAAITIVIGMVERALR